MKSSLLFISTLILFASCNTATDSENKIKTQEIHAQGKALMETKCYACHNPTTPMDSRMAPPMIAVKDHYKKSSTDRTDFVAKFVVNSSNPTKETSLMPKAVKKFELMPNMNFNKEELDLIAQYIFDNTIEKPVWYDEHQADHNADDEEIKIPDGPKEKGLKLALATKKILGKNLMGQINKNGTSAALSFCNEKAYSLVDSMSTVLGASIKRVTDKPRNPQNLANQAELNYINELHLLVEKGETPKPLITRTENSAIGYYPIMTNNMCMQCHGVPTSQINNETLIKIKTLYPNDKAQNYTENKLRGIWVVEMKD